MNKLALAIGSFVLFLLLITALGLVLAFPVMWLMNAVFAPSVLVYLFGVPKVGYWLAYLIYLVTGFLFRGSHSSN